MLIKDRQVKIARDLMLAWNSRVNLAYCVICGSLMQPAKGRHALVCSDACRLKLYRGAEPQTIEQLKEKRRRRETRQKREGRKS
jgi:hypothetical protein